MITSEEIKKNWKKGTGWQLYLKVGNDVSLGNGVRLGSIIGYKYTGTVYVSKEQILIRIGCEIHSIDKWQAHGATLAAKHNESVWWKETGRRMLEFLIGEAELYQKEYLPQNSPTLQSEVKP